MRGSYNPGIYLDQTTIRNYCSTEYPRAIRLWLCCLVVLPRGTEEVTMDTRPINRDTNRGYRKFLYCPLPCSALNDTLTRFEVSQSNWRGETRKFRSCLNHLLRTFNRELQRHNVSRIHAFRRENFFTLHISQQPVVPLRITKLRGSQIVRKQKS